MDEIVKELVKLADKLDREGKPELASAVDETIQSFAARPKAPLKKMDEKFKKDLLKFLGKVSNNLNESVSSLEELFRRLRYFGIDHEVKGLNLDESLKDMKDLAECMDGASKKFYEFSFGKKPSKDYLKDLLNSEKEQDAVDPFSFADKPEALVPMRNAPKEDVSLTGADKEAPSSEEMEGFWDGAEPEEHFEDDAQDGEISDAK